jgi:hypothetical protein
VRLFNLRYDPKEETDIKDFNPGVLTVMDRIVADYRASVEQFPNVPVDADDPYTPFTEVLEAEASPPSTDEAARGQPDFSGKWTQTTTRDDSDNAGESGWGPAFFIVQRPDRIVVERAFFSSGDLQPPLKFTYLLDGSESRNSVLMGRGMQEMVSKATWEGDKLVITTVHISPGADGDQGRVTSEVTYTLSFERAGREAHPPFLVIETTRSAVEGGIPVTTRTVYVKG